MKKSVVIVTVALLTTVVSFAHYYEPRNISGMEYWHELHKKLYESVRDGVDKADVLKRYSRSFTNSMEGLEWLQQHSGCVNSVSVTSKGLTVRYDASVADSDLPIKLTVETFSTDASYIMRDWEMGGVGRGLALGEELVLPLDKKTILRRDDVRTIFTPVMFKNGKKGFRISVVAEMDLDFGRGRVSNTLYVALSNKSVQVAEEDVDKRILITTESSDGVSLLKRHWFDPISVTPKSLSLWFKPDHPQDFVVKLEGAKRLSAEYNANNEPLVLFAGQSAKLVNERENTITTLTFTPVLFKNHCKVLGVAIPRKPLDGFRVMVNVNDSYDGSNRVTDTRYIVLSDTPVLKGEAELDDGSVTKKTPPSREAVKPAAQAGPPEPPAATPPEPVETPVTVAGDEPSEEKTRARNLPGNDGIEYLKSRNWFSSILITPTNLVFTFKDTCPEVAVFLTQQDDPEQDVFTTRHIEKGEPLILPAGYTLCVSPTSHSGDMKGAVRLTPVVFRNQMNGFRITEVHSRGWDVRNVGYIALSKSPAGMGEEDVEMILLWKRKQSGRLYGAEWKTPEEIRQLVLTERTAEPQPPAPTGMDAFEFFARQFVLFSPVAITSTNMAITINAICYQVVLSRDPYIARSSKEYALNKEPLILTPDREIALMCEPNFYLGSIIFDPVIFKNQHKGFRISLLYDYSPSALGIVTNTIVYAVLSDTYMRGRTEDVEMIMENGEWKPFEGKDEVFTFPQRRDEPVTATEDETVVTFAEDEPSEGRATASPAAYLPDGRQDRLAPPSRFWLYALISFCALSAVLWLAHRKRKHDTKN